MITHEAKEFTALQDRLPEVIHVNQVIDQAYYEAMLEEYNRFSATLLAPAKGVVAAIVGDPGEIESYRPKLLDDPATFLLNAIHADKEVLICWWFKGYPVAGGVLRLVVGDQMSCTNVDLLGDPEEVEKLEPFTDWEIDSELVRGHVTYQPNASKLRVDVVTSVELPPGPQPARAMLLLPQLVDDFRRRSGSARIYLRAFISEVSEVIDGRLLVDMPIDPDATLWQFGAAPCTKGPGLMLVSEEWIQNQLEPYLLLRGQRLRQVMKAGYGFPIQGDLRDQLMRKAGLSLGN